MRQEKTNSAHAYRIWVTLPLVVISLFGLLLLRLQATQAEDTTPTTPTTQDVTDLEQQIRDKQSHIQDLQAQQDQYDAAIKQKQQESLNLKNELSVLDDQIARTDLDLNKLTLQIEKLNLEIRKLNDDITTQEQEIDKQKSRLGELLRVLNQYTRKTYLEISLQNDTFSKFFNQLKYLQTIEQQAKLSLDKIQSLKQEAEAKKATKEEKKQTGEETKHTLAVEKKTLTSQQDYRTSLLSETKNSEQQFQNLLDQAKQEQLNANADIQVLEGQIRQRLQGANELPQGPTDLIWPVVSRKVTAEFHDPSYPFKKYFQHPAIDIGTPQGTPVRAAASGYVGRAKNAGYGYSYILVVHGNDLSTVYGHISQISVVENDFVVQGQVIGYSGGTPGTPGAGRLTTGPHLHFEVRKGGIPVNPRDYLPAG